MDELCQQFRLKIANGSGLASADANWTFRSTLGAIRRIDYILYSAGCTSESASATWELDFGSDHRSVKALFSFMPGHNKGKEASGYKMRVEAYL